jgi:hypothetical protein
MNHSGEAMKKISVMWTQDWPILLMAGVFIYVLISVITQLFTIGYQNVAHLAMLPISLLCAAFCIHIFWKIARVRRCPNCHSPMQRLHLSQTRGKYMVQCPACQCTLFTGIISGGRTSSGMGRAIPREKPRSED